MLHGSGGMIVGGEAFRAAARGLAERGYVVLLVHYFDRTGTTMSDLRIAKENFATWVETIGDAVDHAAGFPNVDETRIGLVGFSLGAYLSLSEAVFDPHVKGVVEFFGGLPAVLNDKVKAMPPTLILHGEADKVVPVAEARNLERLFKENGVTFEMKLYPSSGHAFFGEDGLDSMKRTSRSWRNTSRGRNRWPGGRIDCDAPAAESASPSPNTPCPGRRPSGRRQGVSTPADCQAGRSRRPDRETCAGLAPFVFGAEGRWKATRPSRRGATTNLISLSSTRRSAARIARRRSCSPPRNSVTGTKRSNSGCNPGRNAASNAAGADEPSANGPLNRRRAGSNRPCSQQLARRRPVPTGPTKTAASIRSTPATDRRTAPPSPGSPPTPRGRPASAPRRASGRRRTPRPGSRSPRDGRS